MIKYFFMLEEKEGVPVTNSSLDNNDAVVDTSNYKLFTDPPLKITNYGDIMRQHFGKYPIIFINFKCKDDIETIEDAKKEARIIIWYVFKRHEYLVTSSKLNDREKEFCRKFCNHTENDKFIEENIEVSLLELSMYLCKHFVVLIDEYDYLCSKSMMKLKKTEDIKTVIGFYMDIINFLLKDNHENIEFAFLTGISFICTTGFSSITNIDPHKFLQSEELINFYGLTEQEFECLLRPYVSKLVLTEAKIYYNGYECNGIKVYSLWSALKVIYSASKQIDNYWVASGIFEGLSGERSKSPL